MATPLSNSLGLLRLAYRISLTIRARTVDAPRKKTVLAVSTG